MKPVRSLSVAALFACLLNLASPAAGALEVKGVTFADQVTVAGKKLALNGVGLRQATFLKVNVYAGALYAENKSSDGEKIAASPELKQVEMVFLRDVDKEKIAGAWAEGWENNCADGCETGKAGIAKLQSITQEMKKGDKMVFVFSPEKVEVAVKSEKPVAIAEKDFSKNLIRLWIGKKPPNSELKEGMLGIKD